MPRKSSIAIFIAATSALAISSPVSGGEQDLGGLKEWNTDMSIDADFILDKDAQKIADEAAKSSTCIPVGEGENCWWIWKRISIIDSVFEDKIGSFIFLIFDE